MSNRCNRFPGSDDDDAELSCQIPQAGPNLRNIFCMCSSTVIWFLATVLAFTVGLILGALFLDGIIFFVLPALVVLAAILAVIIIALLIFRRCFRCNRGGC